MSYEIAATGLNAVHEQLDGISNNIANAGTVGYKSMTTQFSAMYAGSQAMGVSVAGTAQSISRGGSLVSTGNALDLAINDDGFFVTCDSAGNISYTRAGSFETDKNGYIVNASGAYLQGYPVDDSGTLQTGTVTDIQIKTGNIPAQASSSLTFTANFDASDDAIDRTTVPFDATNSSSYTDSYTTTVYDSLGNEHSVCQYFTKTSDNTVSITIENRSIRTIESIGQTTFIRGHRLLNIVAHLPSISLRQYVSNGLCRVALRGQVAIPRPPLARTHTSRRLTHLLTIQSQAQCTERKQRSVSHLTILSSNGRHDILLGLCNPEIAHDAESQQAHIRLLSTQ